MKILKKYTKQRITLNPKRRQIRAEDLVSHDRLVMALGIGLVRSSGVEGLGSLGRRCAMSLRSTMTNMPSDRSDMNRCLDLQVHDT